jgi:hypothetical protein
MGIDDLPTCMSYTSSIIIEINQDKRTIKILKTRFSLEDTLGRLRINFGGYNMQYNDMLICFSK